MEESALIEAISRESEQPVDVVEDVLDGLLSVIHKSLVRQPQSFELSSLGRFSLSDVGIVAKDVHITYKPDDGLRHEIAELHYKQGLR